MFALTSSLIINQLSANKHTSHNQVKHSVANWLMHESSNLHVMPKCEAVDFTSCVAIWYDQQTTVCTSRMLDVGEPGPECEGNYIPHIFNCSLENNWTRWCIWRGNCGSTGLLNMRYRYLLCEIFMFKNGIVFKEAMNDMKNHFPSIEIFTRQNDQIGNRCTIDVNGMKCFQFSASFHDIIVWIWVIGLNIILQWCNTRNPNMNYIEKLMRPKMSNVHAPWLL